MPSNVSIALTHGSFRVQRGGPEVCVRQGLSCICPALDYSPGSSAPITAAAAVPPAGNAWA
jgi:hypothetical protein